MANAHALLQAHGRLAPSVGSLARRSWGTVPHQPGLASSLLRRRRPLQFTTTCAQQSSGGPGAQPLVPTTAEALSAAAKVAVQSKPPEAAVWDLDWFHYTPWWYKPHIVIIAGCSFIVGCNLGTSPCLKTTLIASAPVAVAWFIFLHMIPRQFKDFATSYITEHPECEQHARAQQAAAKQGAQAASERH